MDEKQRLAGNPVPGRIQRAEAELAKAMADAEIDFEGETMQPLVGPFTAGIGFHDGPFVAINDGNGQRVAEIYDICGAAELCKRLNLAFAAAAIGEQSNG